MKIIVVDEKEYLLFGYEHIPHITAGRACGHCDYAKTPKGAAEGVAARCRVWARRSESGQSCDGGVLKDHTPENVAALVSARLSE